MQMLVIYPEQIRVPVLQIQRNLSESDSLQSNRYRRSRDDYSNRTHARFKAAPMLHCSPRGSKQAAHVACHTSTTNHD